MPEPAFAAAGHTRWSVEVPANGEASFTVRIRQVYQSHEDVNKWQLNFIEALQAAGLLPGEQYKRLEQLSLARQQAREATEEIKTLQAEYAQLAPRQEQLRKNLETLGTAERELAIRNRVLDDLEASENRRRELEQRMALLNAQVESYQQQQQVWLDELFAEGAGSPD
jgi:chromosome segregation ATPase